MDKTKVTSKALREMAVGETLTFELPDAAAIYSGKAIAYRVKNIQRCKFTTTADFTTNRLTITKYAQS